MDSLITSEIFPVENNYTKCDRHKHITTFVLVETCRNT